MIEFRLASGFDELACVLHRVCVVMDCELFIGQSRGRFFVSPLVENLEPTGLRQQNIFSPRRYPTAPFPAAAAPADAAPKRPERQISRQYSRITDQYQTLEQVTESLSRAGLESSNLILGIDFTKSNEWTGKHSFGGRSLHAIVDGVSNPYESAIAIIGQTLSRFDEDNLIPCFGFGDITTHDQRVFSFFPNNRPCEGFQEALGRYRQLVPHLRLAGPTSFAPIIEAAIDIVEESGGQYHVLVIVADGQVTRSVDTGYGRLSPQESATIDAIVAASDYPLSIVLVGVGDGPWDMMREFDDNIPERAFDNFQFVNFSEIMARSLALAQKETMFALAALMEIPQQFKATQELGLLGRRRGRVQHKAPLPPPQTVIQADSQRGPAYGYPSSIPDPGAFSYNSSFSASRGVPGGYTVTDSYPAAPDYSLPPHLQPSTAYGTAYAYPPQPRERDSTEEQLKCQVCYTNKKDMVFGCGHQTCQECGNNVRSCPFCREPIATRIKLYN
ncbi:hypothetical protein R1flu_000726 [Riccia fluitans]|uniref:RING-type domain-containing protein n=1 Tax=Riccia fluitans TaxID=41844 RepID=A0ABD1Y1L6_9MARC